MRGATNRGAAQAAPRDTRAQWAAREGCDPRDLPATMPMRVVNEAGAECPDANALAAAILSRRQIRERAEMRCDCLAVHGGVLAGTPREVEVGHYDYCASYPALDYLIEAQS